MIEEATIVISGDRLLSSIWYSDGSGAGFPGVGIEGTADEWEIVRVRKGDDGLVEIDIKRIKDKPKTFSPSKVLINGIDDPLPVEAYVYNDGQRFGSEIKLRGSLVSADMSKLIGMNTRLTWIGRPWVVSSLPRYDHPNDLLTLQIHLLD